MRRTNFEAAIVRIKANLREKTAGAPTCFISYAWDDGDHEQWVLRLATDLKKAGIGVLLDRWDNPPGTSISQFIDLILTSQFALVIGTPLLKQKYSQTTDDAVIVAEQKMINTRLRQPAKYGQKVIPILLAGGADTSFTPALQDVVNLDFRKEPYYFYHLFKLIVQLYGIDVDNPLLLELQNSLKPGKVSRE